MANEIIEIEGNVARIIQKTISRQIPLDELLKHIERTPEIILPTLPRSAVFSSWHQVGGETHMGILCELQPAVRSITKNNRRSSPRGMRRYRLSMPWTYFWYDAVTTDRNPATTFNWSVYDAKVFFGLNKYQDINTPLMVAPIPNLSSNGEICYGSTAVAARQSLADQLDQRTNEWYLTDFNDDLDGNVRLPYGESNYRRWVTESRENPQSWREWPEWTLTDRNYTVKRLLEGRGIELPVAERFQAGGFIPHAAIPLTFGGWEEWVMQLPADQRIRAYRAIENIREDNPELVPEEATATIAAREIEDDGGVPV